VRHRREQLTHVASQQYICYFICIAKLNTRPDHMMPNTITSFTPTAALTGGALIGLAAVMMMAGLGRVAGISGIVSRLLPPYTDAALPIRAAFVIGLVVAPVIMRLHTGPVAWPHVWPQMASSHGLLAVSGLLVGFGAELGSGCTSGHGVCGLARWSARSAVATGTFMASAALVVFVARHVLGG
jgi:uncharacterized protein